MGIFNGTYKNYEVIRFYEWECLKIGDSIEI